VVLAALLLLVNPLSTPRYVTGTALLAVVVSLGAATTRGRVRRFAVLLAAGLVLVFPYADFARYADGSGAKEGGPSRVLASADFDAFAQVNNAVAYVRAEPVEPGRQLAGAVLFWVPRSIWSEKPQDTGIVLAEFRNYPVTNLSAPLWAEFLVNGGWVLLVLLSAVLGWVLRASDNRIIARSRYVSQPGVLACALPFYFLILLRGSLLQAMAGLAVLVTCGFFVTRWTPPRAGRARLPAQFSRSR
jgi:hypothetical protein